MRLKKKDEVDEIGLFWFPEKAEEKSPGRLILKDGEIITVEMMTSLTFSVGIMEQSRNDTRRVIGQLKSGLNIILEECFWTKKSTCGTMTVTTFLVHRAMISSGNLMELLMPANAELRFKTVSFGVDGLNHWISRRLFISGQMPGETGPREQIFTFIRPDDIPLKIEKGMRLIIRQRWMGSEQWYQMDRSLSSSFCLETEKPERLEYFMEAVSGLTHLLKVAYGQSVALDGPLVLTTDNLKMQTPDGSEYHIPIQCYRQSRYYPHREPEFHQMLFSYQDLDKDDPEGKISNFLEKTKNIGPVKHQYSKALLEINAYDQFLELTKGIECLYEVAEGKRPRNFKKALAGLLRPFMGNGTPFLLSDVDVDPKEIKGFVGQVNTFRNCLTHPYPDRTTDLPGNDIVAITWILEVLYQLTFLRFCGFTVEKIFALCKSCSRIEEKLRFRSKPSWYLGLTCKDDGKRPDDETIVGEVVEDSGE